MEGRFPERAVIHAVRGMVMHNRLGAQLMKRLKVYAGPEHPHAAQKPIPWTGPEALLKQRAVPTAASKAPEAPESAKSVESAE